MRVLRPIPDPGASARSVAFDLLGAILGRKRPLDEAFDAHPALPSLSARDRAFTRQLVSTTLRRLGQIDTLIDHCLERPLPRNARAVRDLLRLGVCQLLFLDTPPHAAVATTVELAQHTGHGAHKKLANAILHRLEREGRALVEAQDAARLNTPDWLWTAWRAAYGETGFVAADDDAFAEAAVRLLTDDSLWRRQHRAALDKQRGWGWPQAAAAFERLIP